MRFPWFSPSSDTEGRNLRRFVRHWGASLSVAARGAKRLTGPNGVSGSDAGNECSAAGIIEQAAKRLIEWPDAVVYRRSNSH
jgi:hypothetical protein